MRKVLYIFIASLISFTLCFAVSASNDSFADGEGLFDSSWMPNVLEYEFTNGKKGSADGIITVTLGDDEADYQTATLYFAGHTGILEDYLPIAEITLSGKTGSYTVSGSRGFPTDATRICTVLSGDGLAEKYYWYSIPKEKLFDEEQPLFTFYCISDTHIGATYADGFAFNRQNAVDDIIEANPDFLIINGDIVEQGTSENFAAQTEFLDAHFNSRGIPTFITVGNHEYYNENSEFGGYDEEGLYESFDNQIKFLANAGFEIKRPDDKFYYSVTVENRRFIFMSMPDVEDGVPYNWDVSESQLAFIEEELRIASESGNTVFLISHVGLSGYIPGAKSVITNTPKMEALLAKYPNVIMATGHSHSDLSTREADFVKVGNMTGTFTHLNDGCAIYLNKYNYTGTDKQLRDYSAGQVIEVYSDRILVKSRKFTADSKFFGHGVFLVDVPHSATDDGEKISVRATFDKATDGDYTVIALYDGDGRMLDCSVVKADTNVVEAQFDACENASFAKAFLFEKSIFGSPVCDSVKIAVEKA